MKTFLRAVTAGCVVAAAAVTMVPAAVAEPDVGILATFGACDPSGSPTASDATVAAQLNTQLTGKLAGAMTPYRVSCARMIVQAVDARGLSDRAATIAITTVIVESSLQNYTSMEDHDSLGLFQQIGAWGTAAQRTDPMWATNAFLNKMISLYPDDSWLNAPIGEVCQAVQVSAYPERYQPQATDGQRIVDALWKGRSADVTGDGLADLVGRTAAGDLLLYPHSGAVNGEATWRSSTKVSHGWSGMTAIVLGDVTGDGLSDLVGQTAEGDLLLYPHSGAVNGEATWRSYTKVSHGWSGMTAVLLNDVTGDGKADLVGRTATGDLLLYANSGVVNGEATFRAGVKVSHGWSGMTAIVLGDVTGDGLADLIGQTATGDLLLYPHSGTVNGEATWRSYTKVSHGWSGMTAILLNDVTGDAKADLVGCAANGDLLLYANSGAINGEATFRAGAKVSHGWSGMTAILL